MNDVRVIFTMYNPSRRKSALFHGWKFQNTELEAVEGGSPSSGYFWYSTEAQVSEVTSLVAIATYTQLKVAPHGFSFTQNYNRQ